MNEFNLQIAKSSVITSPSVSIDGNEVKLTRGKNSQRDVCHYTTEKDCVEIVVEKHYELEGKWWFLMSMLFFFVSVLGIFDTRIGKRFYSVNYRAKVYLRGDTNLQMRFLMFREGERAVELSGDAEIVEMENLYSTNKKLRKRRRILVWCKVLVWLALLAGLLFWVISQL